MGGNLGGWGDPPPLRPGLNVVPFKGKHHKAGRDMKPRKGSGGKPPEKGCGGKKKMFDAAFIMIFVVTGSLAQMVNVVRTVF